MEKSTFEKRRYRVMCLFRMGYGVFKDGMPEPSNHIEAMGWRLARREKLKYEIALERACELFAELTRCDDLGYLD